MAALETVECSTHIINVLNHSLDASGSLESLSNVWDRQAHLLDGLSSKWDERRKYWPAHLLNNGGTNLFST